MILPGLTTVTTRHLSVEETVNIVCEQGLKGIEWEGIKHVIPGDLNAAENARKLCEANEIVIPSYGSYYRVGMSEETGMPFSSVMETALVLGAPCIRVWAGERDYEESGTAYIGKVVCETLRIADLAGEQGLQLVFEFHGDSLTNTTENALRFAKKVEHPAVTFSWQPPHAVTQRECEESLTAMLPLLNTIHVFQWDMGTHAEEGYTRERYMEERIEWVRHPLSHGLERWRSYLKIADTTGRDHWALLEFSQGDSKVQLIEDAKILLEMLGQIQ